MKTKLSILILLISLFTSAAGQSKTFTIINDTTSLSNRNVIQIKTSQVELINKSFDSLVENLIKDKKERKPIWDTLIPLLIGAFLTLIPQTIFWFLNKSKEKDKLKLDIKADLNRLEHLLCDYYRELAMHKAHKPYWYAQFERSEREGNSEETVKFYNFHINSGNKVRETEIKISSAFSEFYGQIIKFQHLTKFEPKIKKYIDDYYSFKPIKPNSIDSTMFDLPAEETKEEKRLLKDYKGFTKPIKKIVRHLNIK